MCAVMFTAWVIRLLHFVLFLLSSFVWLLSSLSTTEWFRLLCVGQFLDPIHVLRNGCWFVQAIVVCVEFALVRPRVEFEQVGAQVVVGNSSLEWESCVLSHR